MRRMVRPLAGVAMLTVLVSLMAASGAPDSAEALSSLRVGEPNVSVSPTVADTQRARVMSPPVEATWVEERNVRLSGETRFETAAAVSKNAYPSGASTVIVATGRDFPDSLSAAALGAKLQAPLLLVEAGSIPAATKTELKRLKPTKIFVVGGTSVVKPTVESQLKGYATAVQRLAGADRYQTSVAIAKAGWKTSSQVFVATGTDFADALSAGAAAGELGVPVILVPGNKSAAPAAVKNLIKSLKVNRIHIAGGTVAISTALQKSIAGSGVAVTRYAGETRYETSAKIVSAIFKGKTRDMYWASGTGFADALTGAAAAGAAGSPMLLVTKSCVPVGTYDAHDKVASGRTFVLGGTQVMSKAVLTGNECMSKPKAVASADWSGVQDLYKSLNTARYNAGLSAFRVADSASSAPAYAWTKNIAKKGLSLNPKLAVEQPWAVYHTVAQTDTKSNKAARLGELMLADSTARSWLLKPSGGVRGAYSVGYTTSGAKGYATVIVGTKLK